jgi:hypothetical protein
LTNSFRTAATKWATIDEFRVDDNCGRKFKFMTPSSIRGSTTSATYSQNLGMSTMKSPAHSKSSVNLNKKEQLKISTLRKYDNRISEFTLPKCQRNETVFFWPSPSAKCLSLCALFYYFLVRIISTGWWIWLQSMDATTPSCLERNPRKRNNANVVLHDLHRTHALYIYLYFFIGKIFT